MGICGTTRINYLKQYGTSAHLGQIELWDALYSLGLIKGV
jgi:hypothetical protein